MNDRFRQLEALFNQAVSMPADERAHWIDGLGIAPDLRSELERLLAADAVSQPLTAPFDAAIAAATQIVQPGIRLGQWRLLREIGAGGSGVVWLAERADAQYEQQAAIKINRAVAASDAAAQLRHERQILATLDHPVIARLLDGGETGDGHPYLVMDYVRGEPLTDACARRQLDLRARMALVAQLARGVHYAHQRLVIHRDIKPGNILLRDDGRPVLLDFGIAKLFGPNAAHADTTRPWFTPAYASPEQKAKAPISTATDVYALGLVLCELVSGREPEVAADGTVSAPSLRADATARRSLKGDADAIVARACAPEPQRRYASAEALADDIERWLGGHPIVARPDTPWYRLGKFVRRHPVGVAFGSAACCVIAATLFWLQTERARALRAEATAQREAAAAAAVSDFLVDVFREAEPGAGRSRAMTPLGLVERGSDALARRDDLAPATRARMQGVLGTLYGYLGEPERATAMLRSAVELADQSHAAATDRIEYRRALASALDDRVNLAASELRFREALAIAERAGLTALAIDLRGDVGFLLAKRRRHDEAEAMLSSAIADSSARRGADSVETARLRMFHAEALMLTGRTGDARRESTRAMRALRAAMKPDDPDLLGLMTSHAAVLRNDGDVDGSIAVLEEVIAQRQHLLDHDSVLIASAYSSLGSAYYEQGKTVAATRQFVAALEIGRATLDPHDPSFAIDLNNVGSLYEEQGDYARAEPLLREAHAIYALHERDDPYQVANLSQNLGRLLMFRGRRDESLRYLEHSIPDRPGGDWAVQRARQQLHLADWHRRFGRIDDAQSHLDRVREADLGGPDSPRVGALLRLRGLIAIRHNDFAQADDWLAKAADHWRRTRGPDYVGVGDVLLDRAELARRRGQSEQARAFAAEATRLLDPVLAPEAPQRARLAALSDTPT